MTRLALMLLLLGMFLLGLGVLATMAWGIDWTLQDVTRCTGVTNHNAPCRSNSDCGGQTCASDGVLTAVAGLDSVSASPQVDSGPGTGQCTCAGLPTCTSSADCPALCGGATTYVCSTDMVWPWVMARQSSQVANWYTCGKPGHVSWWWQEAIGKLIDNPHDYADLVGDLGVHSCRLSKGSWGRCTTGGAACAVDGDCGGNGPCDYYIPDVVLTVGGYNDLQLSNALVLGDADGGVAPIVDWFGDYYGPRAATSPTGLQATRVTCTTDQNCIDNVGTGSVCAGYCTGHTDPVIPCTTNAGCAYCDDDSERYCLHPGDGADYYFEGTRCAVCNANTCVTGPTKYCTIPCGIITCSTDADCRVTGAPAGGYCDGTGHCRACGMGGATQYSEFDSASAWDAWHDRVTQSHGRLSAEGIYTQRHDIEATILARGTLSIWGSYTLAGTISLVGDYPTLPQLYLLQGQLAKDAGLIVADIYHRARYWPRATAIWPGGSANLNNYMNADPVHTAPLGSTLMADTFQAVTEAIYPVCTADTSVACGYCDVPCTTAADCGGSPATCSGSKCHCPTAGSSSGCPTGATCRDIGGTDLRCVAADMANCPTGNGGTRKHPEADAVCSSGTCTTFRVAPLCTIGSARCAATSDCTGQLKGDVCAVGGRWITCASNADCLDGGAFPDDTCQSGVCQQP